MSSQAAPVAVTDLDPIRDALRQRALPSPAR